MIVCLQHLCRTLSSLKQGQLSSGYWASTAKASRCWTHPSDPSTLSLAAGCITQMTHTSMLEARYTPEHAR